MNKEKATATIKHLEKTKQAWCFDELGKIWTLQTLGYFLLIAETLKK